MANIGLKYLKYAKLKEDNTYDIPKSFGAAINAQISLNTAEASLYGDNQLIEYASTFQSANVSLEVDDDDDTVFAEVLGKTINTETGVVSSGINDSAPYVGISYIVSKIKNGTRKFRAQFFPKIQFKPFIPEASTKGESLEFKTVTVEGITIPNSLGIWEQHIDVVTEEEAIEELEKFFEKEEEI